MIASLPMYDWPELHGANDFLWQAIRAGLAQEGISAPKQLSREVSEEESWLSPDLLLGQTCGYPFSTMLKDKVRYVTTPVYAAYGCSGPHYSSAIVVHKHSSLDLATLAGTRLAFNSTKSLSGCRAIGVMFGKPQKFFSALIQSGSHRQSARLVAGSTADVAAIDAICWHLLKRHERETASLLKVIGWTKRQPALPLITSLNTPVEVVHSLRKALNLVTKAGKTTDICNKLAIGGFKTVDLAEYAQLSRL